VARYFDRAWLIYKGAETAVYADLSSTQKRGGDRAWHGTLIGPVNWSQLRHDRDELELRTLCAAVGRFYVTGHDAHAVDKAEISGVGPPPF
jgi:hypothetical protein